MSTDATDATDATVVAGTSNTPPLIYRGHSDYIFSLAFSPAGTTLASASRDTTVRVWRVNQSRVDTEDITVYREHKSSLLSVAWSPDGKYIASGDTTGVINVWHAYSGATILTYH